MASAIEADVTCPVCLELFSQPVLLRCLHTLCSSCSSLVEIEPMKIQCPTCREITARNDIVHDFKTQNWVDLYKQLKAKELHETPSAPPADVNMQSSLGNPEPESTQRSVQISKEAEAMAPPYCSDPPPIGFNVAGPSSLYPSLSPPPSYSEVVSPGATAQCIATPSFTHREIVTPEEESDEKSLRKFLNVDLNQEEVFKFREKALSISCIQGKIWVVLASGSIKVFKKTGYQFGKYISSDIEVYQQSSALWSVLQWKEGADKYVYKVKAVTEAHNGDIIAACAGCVNSWSFDRVGLVLISALGHVSVTISSKHYSDVTRDGKFVYGTPIEDHKSRRIEIFQHDSHNWVLQRKIIIDRDVKSLAVGHDILFTSNAGTDPKATKFCKYDLMGKSQACGKHSKYNCDVIENDVPVLSICCADPHGSCLAADATHRGLLVLNRTDQWTPLSIRGRTQLSPRGCVIQDANCLVMLADNEAGLARLVQFYKV